ncbi:anaerobic coproporphyrinogen III oxidase [Anaerobacterium chartisolvens]|uniref:Coproporphyrinogen-III oxidase n=1 Tax=Anaerobacterium chartisolvens TaxID=1297424 RepID=A0A369B4S3_9FIRM|nr:oxygen-independent coproporphyrinogen III oxidase [Anaerobacterium chartisolvens]RCX16305.1 anaerobic coproporphyrinogen III oxidase [Anaerobacterium chartisolvens]
MKLLREMDNQDYLKIEYLSKTYNEASIPLYISYPTLTCWNGNSSEAEYIEGIRSERNPFLYFHFPYCKSACYYCLCYKMVGSSEETIDRYLDYMEREIRLKAQYMPLDEMNISQMHWGGGTPTNLTPRQLERIFTVISDNFNITSGEKSSISIESYPDDTLIGIDKLKLIKELGFTEISFGIQDFDDRVQRIINRDCKPEVVEKLFNEAKKLGLRIHVDLCYGLPFQEISGFRNTLEKILMLQPDRIAMENYSHFPAYYPLQRLIPTSSVPNSFNRIVLSILANELLTEGGYVRIGDHYVKQGNNMHIAFEDKKINRDLMGYSISDRRQVVAFGSSGISFIDGTYCHNKKTAEEYFEDLDSNKMPLDCNGAHKLNQDDKIRAAVILKYLLTYYEIDKTAINKDFDIDFDEYFASEIKQLDKFASDGIVTLEDDKIKVTDMGRYVVKHVAFVFDNHYRKA